MKQKMEKPQRLHALDGIRGICAISIMIYHIFFHYGTDYVTVGYFGVYVFFALSGFSLWYVYASREISASMLKHFAIARIARIVPLYAAISTATLLLIAGTLGVDALFEKHKISEWLLNITMLFGFESPGLSSIVPGGWSLGVEWVFYIVFPFLIILLKSPYFTFFSLIAALIVNQSNLWVLVDSGIDIRTPEGWGRYIQFNNFLMYFLAGILTAQIHAAIQQKLAWREQLFSPLRTRLLTVLGIALIFIYPASTPNALLFGWHVPFLLFAMMVSLLFGAAMPNISAKEGKVYSLLGDISYSTYLINFYVAEAISRLLPKAGFTLSMILIVGITLASSYASVRFFEYPARRYLVKRFGPKADQQSV